MGSFVVRRWAADPVASGPRRARAGGTYRAFVPDRLADVSLDLPAAVAADVADAERAMLELDASVHEDRGPHRLEVLARLLLRAEAVGSSQIEGLRVTPRNLALADLEIDRSGRAAEIVGNIRALTDALSRVPPDAPVTTADLCAIHRRLLTGTPYAALGGIVREEQNWIGGLSPLDADFVPPPPEELPGLLDDLCAYVSGDEHSPLVQAALAHAWFETLHPFADGNGRTGRALIHLVLRRRGLCRRFVPPISLVLSTWSKRYVAGLMATRGESPELAAWIELMAEATRQACGRARAYERSIDDLLARWRERVGAVRADAAVWALLERLPAAPLVSTASASLLTGRSERAIDGAIAQLVAAGILRQVGGRMRYRLFEAREVFEVVAEAERAVARGPT